MIQHIESASGFVATVASAIFGAITVPSIAEIATNESLPDWAKWLLGPLGALVGMVVAIKWLTSRLDRSEAREEERRKERDNQMAEVIALGIRATTAIEQNSQVLDEVKGALKRPPA